MFVLEYKQLHIVHESVQNTKNRTHQTYRWKQYAMCEEKKPLEQILNQQKRKDDWRIEEYPC